MIVGLDHIAIATDSIDRSMQRLIDDLGMHDAGSESVNAQSVRVGLAVSSQHADSITTKIEMIEPTCRDSSVGKFLERRGGGLHHLCFRSDSLDDDIRVLKKRGYRFLTDVPTIGSGGKRIIFIDPKSFDGILVELSESVPNDN